MNYKYSNIFISGLPGSGKTSLTKSLARETQFKVHSIGGLFRVEHEELKHTGKTSLTFEEWWKSLPDKEQIAVNIKLKKLAEIGGIIGDARYAKFCNGTNSLHIFLYADLKTRAQRALMSRKYPEKTVKEIGGILSQREKDEVNLGKKLFNFDYRNLGDYHKSINTGIFSVQEETNLIMDLMRKMS